MNYSIKKKWNQRYKHLDTLPTPNETLQKFIHLIQPGRALDIACGVGQNATFLHQLGFEVDAVDISEEGLKYIDKNITTHCCDISQFMFEKEAYDLIVNFNFLDRSIFFKIKEALKPGGTLIFETFNYKKQDFNLEFLLAPNELLDAFKSLHILYYDERGEKSTLVAQKALYYPKKNPHDVQIS